MALRLVIIDGYSLLFRAFYGTRFLSTTDGRPTNALFGFTSMIFNLLENEKPDAILVALDAPGKTFRHAEYAEYKGTRRETPQELVVQFPVSRDLVKALGIPSIELTGYEADDIVGTVSRKAEEAGYSTTIVTGDLDSLQLVDDAVTVMTTRQGVTDVVRYDPQAVVDRYGFGPEYITDYKALVGDTSDNIPGVPGIGEKSATKLIQQFGPVEMMVEKLDDVEEKFRKKIEPNLEQLRKSKWLATIDRDIPIEYDFAPFRVDAEQIAAAKGMLEWLEFRSLAKRLEKVVARYIEGAEGAEPVEAASVAAEALEIRSGSVQSYEELSSWVASRRYAVTWPASAVQRSMFDEPETSHAYVAIGNEVRRAPADVAVRLLNEHGEHACLHDAKPAFKRHRVRATPGFDSMLAAYVLQSDRSSYDVRDLVQGYLDVQPPTTDEQVAVCVGLLEAPMRERLEKEHQTRVLDEVELPLIPLLAEMETWGIAVDTQVLVDFSKSLDVQIQQIARTIYELAGAEFVIGSPKQLGEVLFDKLGIPGSKKTKTGYATGVEVLQGLAAAYPICGEVLNWRELTKLKSTYADALPKMVGDDGRIHTTFNQTVAATGRLSSIDPNLQNIPIRTELGRHIRSAFVAAPGFRLASFDYSQIELRLLAHLCRDEALVEAFQSRVDVHTVTASLMFGIGKESVTKEQRRLAKMLNYAVLYGVTDFGLANQLGEGFSVSEAKGLIGQYFDRFPRVRDFTVSVVEDARSKGFTTTLIGRRRYFPNIHAANRTERMYAERQAVNAPIQGAAADMVKMAMLAVWREFGTRPTRMLLQVHDELVFELAAGDDEIIEPIRGRMEQALPLNVPVEVDGKIGPNWNQMTPVL